MDLPGRPSRRGFLAGSAAGAARVALSPGARAQQVVAPPEPLENYRTAYFTAAEWVFVMAACARLIPSDGEGPGAIEARVPVFIDGQMVGDYGNATALYMQGPHDPAADPTQGYQSPLTPAGIYREGIAAVQAICMRDYGARFEALDAAMQDAVLSGLDKGDIRLAPAIRDFFTILLQNTKEGYFADPMYGGNHAMSAWLYIGFPGARGAYTEWVPKHGQPYPLGPVSITGERA